MGDPIRVACCVFQGHETAPRMTEYCNLIEAEVLPQSVDVVDLGSDGDGLGRDARGRLATPTLIVIDQAECPCKPIQVRQEIVVIEIGSAVENDEGTSIADFPEIEFRTLNREVSFAHARSNAQSRNFQVSAPSKWRTLTAAIRRGSKLPRLTPCFAPGVRLSGSQCVTQPHVLQ